MNNLYIAQKSRKNFEAAALVLSIISVSLCCCFYVSLPAGALAIIFASLSRGRHEHMSQAATAAFIIGIVGVSLSLALIIFSIIYCYITFDSIEDMLMYYSQTMGIDYEELHNAIYGY